jgi:methylthioribose-1-phosphate isomerase
MEAGAAGSGARPGGAGLPGLDEERRTVSWKGGLLDGALRLIDQRALPLQLRHRECRSVGETAASIADMTVRGAPAIGAAGGFGMALAAREAALKGQPVVEALVAAKRALDAARPTAVNLSWATQRLLELARAVAGAGGASGADVAARVLAEAQALADQDVEINLAMGRHGSQVVPHGANILHHCNTGALATVDVGTALGVVYECHRAGKGVHVWVDETRPRLQGARLTAWELMREGVPMHLIADNAAGLLMLQGKVDVVLYGADRVAANGDVANKVGTYKISVVAREHGIPVYPVVPTSTIDLDCATGAHIPIEERDAEEVTMVGAERIAPPNVRVFNPAFDVTPAKYVTGIITEEGICYPPYAVSLRAAKERAEAKILQRQRERLRP